MKNTTLTVAAFNPFTGPDASFGPEAMAGCLAAQTAINAAGGVLTDKVACQAVDTRGDPADAVTAGAKMLATTSHLFGVLGPSSDEADATVPLIAAAKVTMFADTGEASFDRTTDKFFWRLTPADDSLGYSMALYARKKGYLRAAAVFGNDISSQGEVPTLVKAFKALGGNMVADEKIALGQSSYQPEVEQLIAAKPQVIFTEAGPQANATFFSELQQLGHLIPIIATQSALVPAWFSAVGGAIGKPTLAKYFVGSEPYAPASGPGWAVYNTSLLAAHGVSKPVSNWTADSYSMTDYDGVVIMALAAVAAKSTSPAVYNNYIQSVTSDPTGTVQVHSYAEGLAALKAGKKIDYVGAGGPVTFNQYHNSNGGFEIVGYQTNGNTPLVATITAASIAALAK